MSHVTHNNLLVPLTSSESHDTVANLCCWRSRANGWSRSVVRRVPSDILHAPVPASWPTMTAVGQRSWPLVRCPTWPPRQIGSCWWPTRPAAPPSPSSPCCSSLASGRTPSTVSWKPRKGSWRSFGLFDYTVISGSIRI